MIFLLCFGHLMSFFADDTNLDALGCHSNVIQSGLTNLYYWLYANKPALSVNTTVQFSRNASASCRKSSFPFENPCIDAGTSYYWYLGVFIASKLSFSNNMESVVRRLRAQCGIVSKLRYFLPQKQLVKFCMIEC